MVSLNHVVLIGFESRLIWYWFQSLILELSRVSLFNNFFVDVGVQSYFAPSLFPVCAVFDIGVMTCVKALYDMCKGVIPPL